MVCYQGWGKILTGLQQCAYVWQKQQRQPLQKQQKSVDSKKKEVIVRTEIKLKILNSVNYKTVDQGADISLLVWFLLHSEMSDIDIILFIYKECIQINIWCDYWVLPFRKKTKKKLILMNQFCGKELQYAVYTYRITF